MKVILSSILLLFQLLCFGQSSPGIQWQKDYGGTLIEQASAIEETSDSGFIVIGYAFSNDLDVPPNHGEGDIWVLKLDKNHQKEWSKCLGGSAGENASSIHQTKDGGYILCGTTSSNDGDVSGHHNSIRPQDYWVVKLDNTGAIQWQKCYGGTHNDNAIAVRQTKDGGYVIVGNSLSKDGDITSHHFDSLLNNNSDIWALRTDSAGKILWQKSLGGTLDEYAGQIILCKSGGFLIAGTSWSIDGEVSGHHTGPSNWGDEWMVRLDDSGHVAWQKSLGGKYNEIAYDVVEMNGGFVIAGSTNSFDGDVKGQHLLPDSVTHENDAWVTGINANGNLLWQKCVGGVKNDIAFSISMPDNVSVVLAGITDSQDGDVTGYHVNQLITDAPDFFVFRLAINSPNDIVWKQCIGGSNPDEARSIVSTMDGGYAIAGYTKSGDGDALGNVDSTKGQFWVVKMNPDPLHPGLNRLATEENLLAYPNPVKDFLQINNIAEGTLVSVFSISGQKVLTGIASLVGIDLSRVQTGMYFLRFENPEMNTQTIKFIKE